MISYNVEPESYTILYMQHLLNEHYNNAEIEKNSSHLCTYR